MTSVNSSPDSTVLRLSLATLVTFLLAGVAILVSANSQIPIVTNSHRLLQVPTVTLQAPPKDVRYYRPTIKTGHHPEKLFANVAVARPPVSHHKESATQSAAHERLSPEQLKNNALALLRAMPDYYPSDSEFNVAVAQMNERIESQQLEINVNTFLLSQHMSNESRLAELQMQPFFAEFDRSVFSPVQRDQIDQEYRHNQQMKTSYTGVGFPHIENNNRSAANRYKPYKQLMSFSDDAGEVVPYVRCMGLSPERVAKRAERYEDQISELSAKYNVSANLIKAVIAKESCFNPKARSHVGAIGLMQLMPETARWLKVKQPENPAQNLAGGVRYLAQLRKRFGGDELALAAYNAGPSNVERYHGIPPFDETEQYVVDVMHFYRGYTETTRYVNVQNGYYYP